MPYFLHPLWKTTIDSLSEEEVWEHFEKCLKAHDWYYNMSDDHGVWQAGEEQKAHIEKLNEHLLTIDAERADKMYCDAAPWLNADCSLKENW